MGIGLFSLLKSLLHQRKMTQTGFLELTTCAREKSLSLPHFFDDPRIKGFLQGMRCVSWMIQYSQSVMEQPDIVGRRTSMTA